MSCDPQSGVRRARHSFLRRLGSPWLTMLVPGLVWAGNAIVARAMAGEVPPIGLAFWRWTLGALFVLPLAWPHVRRDAQALCEHWPIMLVLSAMGIAFFNCGLYLAAQWTTSINILMLQTSIPVLVVLAGYFVFRESVSGAQALGIALSLAGALTLISHGDIHVLTQFRFNAGDLWMLAACFLYAGYTSLLRLRPAVHALSFLFASFGLGALLLLPFYIGETIWVMPMPVSRNAALAILYVAIFPSVIGYLAYNRTVAVLGASTAGLSVYLVPLFGTILAMLLLGEHPELYHAIGMALIVLGILLAVRRLRVPPRSEAAAD
jgi:drug/metabolite transporter (DMT)-like permease